MNTAENKYITVAYELYDNSDNPQTALIEKAPEEYPYQFISGMGLTLDAFENQVAALSTGDSFDFTLSPEDAYGEYQQDRVIELDKQIFSVDGRFNDKEIYPGNYIPMINADGTRLEGLVVEIKDNTVLMDFNMRLAGKTLHFIGKVIESRAATPQEIQGLINRMSGAGCGCGCDCGEDSCDSGGHCNSDSCSCH